VLIADRGRRADKGGLPHGEFGAGARRLGAGRDEAAEAGNSIVGTVVGFTIFLLFLVATVQVLVHLYAESALTSVANNAAEAVADSGGDPAAVPSAQASAEEALGGFGRDHTVFEWLVVDGEEVRLRVSASTPELVPLPAGFNRVSLTVTVRTQRFRAGSPG